MRTHYCNGKSLPFESLWCVPLAWSWVTSFSLPSTGKEKDVKLAVLMSLFAESSSLDADSFSLSEVFNGYS